VKEDKENESCCEDNKTGGSCSCSSVEDNSKAPVVKRIHKIIICLVVLIAAVSIVTFRTVEANGSNTESDAAVYTLGQLAAVVTPHVEDVAQPEQILGEYLESLDDLNSVAVEKDVVFVFIPAFDNDMVAEETKKAIDEAQEIFAGNDITLGLYTMSYDSTDYAEIVAAKIELPVVFVLTKGTGSIILPGRDIDVNMLLQAYLACCDSSSGCCP